MRHAYFLLTVAAVFGAARVTGEFEEAAFRTFDAAVHPCNGRQLILILQSRLLKPTHAHANTV